MINYNLIFSASSRNIFQFHIYQSPLTGHLWKQSVTRHSHARVAIIEVLSKHRHRGFFQAFLAYMFHLIFLSYILSLSAASQLLQPSNSIVSNQTGANLFYIPIANRKTIFQSESPSFFITLIYPFPAALNTTSSTLNTANFGVFDSTASFLLGRSWLQYLASYLGMRLPWYLNSVHLKFRLRMEFLRI